MQKLKAQKGITLIALIITIIVMLILVGVTVTVALQGGLFNTAKDAATKTADAKQKEQVLANGEVNVDGIIYTSMDDYLNNNPKLPSNASALNEEALEGNTTTANWDLSKVTAVEITEEDGTTKNIIPLPKQFQISLEEGENTISEGLVITDGANEFVWIPVADATSYTEDSFGPLTGTHSPTTYKYDSQEELDYFYGTDYYDYDDFTYATDKTNVETSIQTYGGFYVGRYETTIDGSTIGVEQGKPILTCATLLKEVTNATSKDEYHYRWWGLYKAQKDMYANNSSVGSLMISSKQWDAIMTFTGYGSTKRAKNTYLNYDSTSDEATAPDLSGSAYSTDNTQYDVSKNIYDLAGNVREYTLKAYSTGGRTFRGGYYSYGDSSASSSYGNDPSNSTTYFRF